MKKNKLIYIVFLLWAIIFGHSCYDDKSELANNPIAAVIIDTTGINANQYVGYQEELSLSPIISIEGNKNTDHLLYEWALSRTISDSDFDFEIISTEKNLHTVISRPVENDYYTLMLTVTDPENDNLQYLCSWKVYVQSSFVDGLLIADTKDEVTSDFTLIKNKTLTINYNSDEVIYRHILENANGAPYEGIFSSLTYGVFGYPSMQHTNRVWVVMSDGDAVRFDCEEFAIDGTTKDESITLYKPSGLKFKSFFCASQMLFAHTSHGFLSLTRVNSNNFGYYDEVSKGTIPNNDIIAAHSSNGAYYNHTVWLDKEQGKIISYTGALSFNPKLETYIANTNFDPNNMGDKSAIAGIISDDEKVASFLLKDDNSGEYAIYTLNQYISAVTIWDPITEEYIEVSPAIPATAGNKFLIPAEGKTLLNKAKSVFFAQNVSVLYVATEDGIYAITYGSGDTARVYTTARYTPASGEKITKAKIYQQGHWTNDASVLQGNPPSFPTLAWHNKAIIVTTQNAASEGKVYVIPITQTGIGTLDPTQALSYGGFGRILDVITIGY